MPFMEIQVTDFIPWIEIDSSGGSWSMPKQYLSRNEIAAIEDESKWTEVFSDYAEGYDVISVEEKQGFGVRTSAPGYMDATEWERYDTAHEAAERARDLADESYNDEESEEYQDFLERLNEWELEEEGALPTSFLLPI